MDLIHKFIFSAIIVLITGCALVSPTLTGEGEGKQGDFIGYSDGKYVRLYYRVDDSLITLAVENTSILPLYQVIFSVEQKTAAGSAEGQSTLRILRKAQIHTLSFNIPANSTGEVIFTCYFEVAEPSPDSYLKEYLDDRIILHVKPAQDL
ncbi:MAG: hypothetical protein LBD73_06845 [Deferribacteraceae bacterium]|nr:hypothetical protein [Deferribacteraceae bacterium]